MGDFKITDFSMKFLFSPPTDLITDVVSHLAQSNFQLEKIDDVELRFKKLQELFPRMSLRNDSQTFRIDLSSDKLEIDIGEPFIMAKEDIKQKELVFTKENLIKYNSDVNYILGALMSVLHLQKLMAEVELDFESEDISLNFDHLLAKNIVLNNELKTSLEGIQIEVREEIFNIPSKVTYRLWRSKEKSSKGYILFKQEMVLPLQLEKMLNTLSDHFNRTLNQVIK